MIGTIRQIGLFMIVAQTMLHFAAGKQYEKYIKIIAGVIILLLFVRPFSGSQSDILGQWQQEMERMAEEMGSRSREWQETVPDMDQAMEQRVTRQLEEEIKNRFNAEMQTENYKVTDVMIAWETHGTGERNEEQTTAPGWVRVTLRQMTQSEAGDGGPDPVRIEKIRIGGERAVSDAESGESLREYRRIFAELLGIEEDQVEVVCGG